MLPFCLTNLVKILYLLCLAIMKEDWVGYIYGYYVKNILLIWTKIIHFIPAGNFKIEAISQY